MRKYSKLAILVFALMSSLVFLPSLIEAAEAKPAWQVEWEKTLAGAKKEGKLAVMSGASSTDYIGFFRKAFPDIQVEFLELRAPDIQVRLPSERQAGVFAWDIVLLGGSTGVTDLIPGGAFADLRKMFIHPEITKDETWVGNFDDLWVDDDTKKFKIHHKAGQSRGATMWVNRKELPESKFNKIEDIFKAELKGKVCSFDPRVEGAADAQFGMIAVMYGKDFLRRLFKETGMTITRDYRKLTEDTVRGQCLIAVGARVTDFQRQGVGLHIRRFYAFSPTIAPEFSKLVKVTCCGAGKTKGTLDGFVGGGSANNMLSVAERAPHPNAAKVYVNWMLSKEGQMAWMLDDEEQCSRRADLHHSWCVDFLKKKNPDQFVPMKPDGAYISLHTAANVKYRYTSHDVGMEVFGR